MSGETSNKNVYVPIFSFNEDVGESFIKDLGVEQGSPLQLTVGERTVEVELIPVLDITFGDVESAVSKADAAILLVKYLDRVSMSRIRDVHQLIHHETFLPKVVIITRDQKEAQFKIGCSYCGQKLWVRDKDIGRRGNCPQCRKTFVIPAQRAFVISNLMLTETEPVQTVTIGDKSVLGAVESLVNRIISMEDSEKSSTMKIELPPEDASGI